METLQELEAGTAAYIRLHCDNGGLSEFDQSINDISREKIKAFKAERGQAYLSKVNHYSGEPEGIMVEYTGQKVYNFEYDMVSIKDDELAKHICEYRNSGIGQLINAVERIYSRLEDINGVYLFWA